MRVRRTGRRLGLGLGFELAEALARGDVGEVFSWNQKAVFVIIRLLTRRVGVV
jgi:hypothetical protein